jgi:hypothetical protein
MATMERRVVDVRLQIELRHSSPDEWQADVGENPKLEVRGITRDEALAKATAMALRIMADEADQSAPPVTPRPIRVACPD